MGDQSEREDNAEYDDEMSDEEEDAGGAEGYEFEDDEFNQDDTKN